MAMSLPFEPTRASSRHHELPPRTAPIHPGSALPPTPPTMPREPVPKAAFSTTPVHSRDPITPDTTPPRYASAASLAADRPPLYACPSSRAESFTTAREEPSEPSDSRSTTPSFGHLQTPSQDRGLGLAFERDDYNDDDATPTERRMPFFHDMHDPATAGAQAGHDFLHVDAGLPHRDWNTDLMRNITVRQRRKPASPSPPKTADSASSIINTPSPAMSVRTPRTSSLRERVDASSNPPTSSVQNFAESIGWPADNRVSAEEPPPDSNNKRLSTSSMTSTVVAAMVVVTPPQRQRALRHSGKNMAYRSDTSSPARRSSAALSSTRISLISDDVPLHRLVHKRTNIAERHKRFSTDSDTLGNMRNSSPFSVRSSRTIDSTAATLAHQESVRRILQPAADILSRSNSQAHSNRKSHMRVSSAPESARRIPTASRTRDFTEISPPQSPASDVSTPFRDEIAPDNTVPANVNKALPSLPAERKIKPPLRDSVNNVDSSPTAQQIPPPSAILDRVRHLIAEREAEDQTSVAPETRGAIPLSERLSSRERAEKQRRSSHSQDRTSSSQEANSPYILDRVSSDDMFRRSPDWNRKTPDEHNRMSFDRSTVRTEEYGNARHTYSQTTPFSQMSDTPIELSEATAISIYPHNNHSLLLVQQASRTGSMPLEDQNQPSDDAYFASQSRVDLRQELQRSPTPPFVDAYDDMLEADEGQMQPTLAFEPSTPPMQIHLPQPNTVDVPLENPRPPPEPPKIMFIPPTPAEELECDLRPSPPGPPKHSDSYPQRRLSLVQRARRYSDNLISPILARASSNRSRHVSDSHTHSRRKSRIPTVNDEDGNLHPFWRPRGFWDDFEDSDSESDEDVLPSGGDTSDVEDPEPELQYPKRRNTLRKRLSHSLQSPSGFLIGNSLGVERHGPNTQRHHVTLPSHFAGSRSPTQSQRSGHSLVSKSASSLRSSPSFERPRRRQSWRKGKPIPGLKGVQVQYIGLSGVKDRLRERTAEKRRDRIRKSIGTRYYVEPGVPS
jgi:hypothetical protein